MGNYDVAHKGKDTYIVYTHDRSGSYDLYAEAKANAIDCIN